MPCFLKQKVCLHVITSYKIQIKICSQLNPMIEQIIFRNISWINRASYDQFSSHGATVEDFNKIDEVLLCFKASNKLCMIWRPGGGKNYRNQLKVINLKK